MAPSTKRPLYALLALSLCTWFLAVPCVRAAEMTVDTLAALIRDRGVHRVEDAIPLLTLDLRANYTLVFSSRSLQGATPVAPRAILFGTNGRFIVSFNGDVRQRGYDALETMQFDERTNSFHFREIRFDAENGVGISDDNPARCTACHGIPARPIWDTPPNWPGVYGQRYRTGLSKAELAGVRSFLAQRRSGPRYQYLLDAGRFAERNTYVADSHSLYNGSAVEPPNARLSALLATLNVRSLVSGIVTQPAAASHRYALLGAVSENCGDLQSFFPEPVRSSVKTSLEAFERRMIAGQTGQDHAKRQRARGTAEGYHGGIQVVDPIQLRFVAERLVGVPPQRWSLALEEGTYDLAAPEGALTIEQVLFERIAVAEPELRELKTFRSYSPDDAYCAELRKRSKRELKAYYVAAPNRLPNTVAVTVAGVTPPRSRPPLLGRCIECHNGSVGPELPFGEPVLLGQQLTVQGYPRGRLLDEILYRLTPEAGADRMPRGLNPTPLEQEELEDYFLQLALQQASAVDQ